MEPSNRVHRSWRVRKAQEDALLEPDPHAGGSSLPPPSPAQQAHFEPDPAGALLSSPPSPPKPDPAGAPLPSPPLSRPSNVLQPTRLCVVELLPPPSPLSAVLHPIPRPVSTDQSRFNILSLLDSDEDIPSASDSTGGSSDSDDDWDGDPFLTDSQGNLTTWRLSDMEAAFKKHLEEEASKPKVVEKKYSKEEKLKRNADRKKQFMEYALQKYNNEEDLAGEMRFVFDEIKKEVYIVEEGLKLYEHFNFTAKQAGSTVLFFAEVVPHGKNCDVLCCKTLDCNDNGVAADPEFYQEVEGDVQGGDAGQSGPVHTAGLFGLQGSLCHSLGLNAGVEEGFSMKNIHDSLPGVLQPQLAPFTPAPMFGEHQAASTSTPFKI